MRPHPDAVAPATRIAWNAAIYVNQIDDERLGAVATNVAYPDATQTVLKEAGGLWFNDETFVVSRRRH